jgi:hypothetical protein
MDRLVRLLAGAALIGASCAIGAPAIAASGHGCSQSEIALGLCTTGSSDGSGVVLSGTQTGHQPGSGGSGSGGTSSGRPLTPAELQALLNQLCAGSGDCGSRRGPTVLNPLLLPGMPGAPAAGAAPQVVTAADVARFLPAVGVLHSEPDGWAAVGVPANFWLDVRPATVAGTLLGGPAEVRFAPQLYRWIYGDGTDHTTATPGSTWADLGQQELTATATSHVYTARATRQAQVEILYSAEYRVGAGPWLPVVGAVTDATPQRPMLVVTERTVLTPPP